MINNLGPSGILAAPYVAYSACPNDAESILIEGLSDWIWRDARWGWFHCRWKRTTNSESESPSNKAHKNKGDKIGGPACQIKLRPSWPMVYPYILSGLIFVNCHVTQYFASERIVTGKETSWHDVLAAITAMNKTGQQHSVLTWGCHITEISSVLFIYG